MPLGRVLSTTAAAILVSLLGACGGGGDGANAGASNVTKSAASAAAAPANVGERAYQQRCVSCHMVNGLGTPGVFPPLAGAEYVLAANVEVPIRIVMHGIQGPITVKGAEYNSLMPAYGIGIAMSDAELAAVLTYVRSSWGNNASAVTAEDVEEAKEHAKGHVGAMTAELLKPLMAKKAREER